MKQKQRKIEDGQAVRIIRGPHSGEFGSYQHDQTYDHKKRAYVPGHDISLAFAGRVSIIDRQAIKPIKLSEMTREELEYFLKFELDFLRSSQAWLEDWCSISIMDDGARGHSGKRVQEGLEYLDSLQEKLKRIEIDSSAVTELLRLIPLRHLDTRLYRTVYKELMILFAVNESEV